MLLLSVRQFFVPMEGYHFFFAQATTFLDSMATLNLLDWGYGLCYRYGLFKQRITAEGQEEVAEDWLEKFSPWEIVRHDIVYPVRLFGHVEINPDGS
ncbi:hypothetical protein FCM35_KLT01223 [Carex littledalei]|uniref:Alpha-1,4 glucan phosphorylase n=1 Tax=Carex littledalei TaxID=544730 RepID=A0A833R8Z8_9POAL|nr:hypothetical protein FCM35_KLT01223 [Carex littledalei]